MRRQKKTDPDRPQAIVPVPATRITLKRNHAADARANLKRAYESFLRTAKHTGSAAARSLAFSDTWIARPYAASL